MKEDTVSDGYDYVREFEVGRPNAQRQMAKDVAALADMLIWLADDTSVDRRIAAQAHAIRDRWSRE